MKKISLLFIFVLGVFSIVLLSCKNEVSTGSNGTGGSGSGSGSGGEPKNKICSVLFCDDNGNQIFTQDVESGKTVARPQNPEQKNGDDFDNWYTDLSFSTPYDFSLPVTSNLVLFGKWQNTVKFTVSFHAKYYDKNGIVQYQTENIRPSQQMQMGKYLSVPSLPTSQHDGFCFDDWYTESGELFDFAAAITSDTVLYAHFIDNKVLRVNYAPCSTTEMGTISQQNLTDIPLGTTVRFYLTQNRIVVGTTLVTVTPNPKHIIEGFYQDKECTQEYGDTFVSTPGMKIFVKFMRDADMNYLCFTALENSYVGFYSDYVNIPCYLEYTMNEEWNWMQYSSGSLLSLLPGDKIYFRKSHDNDYSVDGHFSMGSGLIAASGNTMSLLSKTCKTSGNVDCTGLFKNCTSLITAPELPALNGCCYRDMFFGCSSLTKAPELPATTSNLLYARMFYGCTSLTEAPDLPATGLNESAFTLSGRYEGALEKMFYGCTSLTETPELHATTLPESCCYQMFYGCTSLTKARKIHATTFKGRCCYQMFYGCTSLTEAPELCVTAFVEPWIATSGVISQPVGSCEGMFENCTSLREVPKLHATTLTYRCYHGMFSGCTSLREAPELPAITLASSCYASMFEGCTSLQEAPELPATTLASGCYAEMFQLCSSLKKASELPATTLAEYCYDLMFQGCFSLQEAPQLLPATTLMRGCYSKMFADCYSLQEAPELPATTLVDDCYYSMFRSCKSLKKVKVAFKFWGVGNGLSSTSEWLKDVNATGTFLCPSSLNCSIRDVDHVPSGWTIVRY